jgi:hypothetical protein
MSWKITPGWSPADADAAAYITAVEAADTAAGQPGGLEEKTKIAIDNFVLGCKADGIWTAIKASCILAGAKTLAGSLVPLTGTAPARQGTEGGWNYNRKTGLQGNGTDNYINSNRNNNADAADKHIAAYGTTFSATAFVKIMGGGIGTGRSSLMWESATSLNVTLTGATGDFSVAHSRQAGLVGANRTGATVITRAGGTQRTTTQASATPANAVIQVFADGGASFAAHRLAFYSIGGSLDLALLDARVTDLINAIGAAF